MVNPSIKGRNIFSMGAGRASLEEPLGLRRRVVEVTVFRRVFGWVERRKMLVYNQPLYGDIIGYIKDNIHSSFENEEYP